MTTAVLLAAGETSGGDEPGAIQVGHYTKFEALGMTFNFETIVATLIAAVILLILAFYLKAKVTSTGVPSGVQLFWETVTIQMRGQIESSIGMRVAPYVLPLTVTLFTFILISNWLSILPAQTGSHELIKPPAADVNFAYALALFAFCWWHLAGFRKRGIIGYPKKILKGHLPVLAPINVVEEFTKPISLSLRLFGNVFAGALMVGLIAMIPWWGMWAPNAIWKSFELFIGFIQAFIFALLTILYFSQALEDDH